MGLQFRLPSCSFPVVGSDNYLEGRCPMLILRHLIGWYDRVHLPSDVLIWFKTMVLLLSVVPLILIQAFCPELETHVSRWNCGYELCKKCP